MCAALLVLAATLPAAGQTAEEANQAPATPLALSGALELAVRQSPTLRQATIDMAVAEAATLESLGIDDWVLTGTGTWSSSRTDPVEGDTFVVTAIDTFSLAAGIGRSLSTGGSLSLSASARRGEETTFLVLEDPCTGAMVETTRTATSVNFAASARFEQPLLRGFGSDVARSSQRLARINEDAAALTYESDALDTIKAIIDSYWEVAYAAREIEIRKGSLELAQEQLRITRAGIEAGSVAPTEALAVEQGILVREEAILVAEVTLANLSLGLRTLIGMEVGPGDISVAATEPLAVDERDFDLDATIARAMERNPNLAIIAKSGESAKVLVEVTEDGLRPRLDFSVTAGPTGNSTNANDALERLAKFDTFSVAATLEYSQTLGRRAARGAHEQRRLEARLVEINLEEARRNIAAQVAQAVNEVRAAKKRIEVSEKSIELAEQNLVNERARFEAGDATNFDILRRQDEIQQAQLAHSRAIVDYRKAVAQVDALTGDLLDRYGIAIEADNP